MPTDIQKANLPLTPFDGQEFIDFRRIKWEFSSAMNCWRLLGPVPEVPLATTESSGLLRAADKILIDSLSPKGGGFGILAQPLLSVVPLRRNALYKGIVHKAGDTPAGSKIVVDTPTSAGTEGVLTSEAYAGKMIYFTTGTLKTQYFLIFTNDGDTFYIMGPDASVASKNDKFEIYEPAAINENGVIQGAIELVSETLDITCVDGGGNPIDPGTCNVNSIFVDDPSAPPGLDIKVSENFKKQFCIVQPGAKGSRGDTGLKGLQGAHGTGDGPTGDQGAAGLDALVTGDFTGIKIVDLDDIYDTAVVAMELDADAGKLHVVKAKIRTPDDTKPADQIVASAISRDVRFIDPEFSYELIMPTSDPIGVDDVEIMHYPQGFSPRATSSINAPDTTEANVIKLSGVVDAITEFYSKELDRISHNIDENQIKPYIESKDREAREELNARADEVARCEWEMPIEFCLGITPENCEPSDNKTRPFPLAAAILGPEYKDAVGTPLPSKKVPTTAVPPPGDSSGAPPSGSTPNQGSLPPTLREPTDPTPEEHTESISYNSRPAYPDDSASGVEITPRNLTWFDSRGRHGPVASGAAVDVTSVDGLVALDPGDYIIMYAGGAGRTDLSTWTSEVAISYVDGDTSDTVYISDADEALLSFDKASFINSQHRAGPQNTAAAFTISEGNVGEASMQLAIEGSIAEGSVDVQIFQINRNALGAPMEVTQTMNRAPDGAGGQAMVTGFTGELDCPDCPDCISTVDCGDVDCPDCIADIVASASAPESGVFTTSIVVDGTGFGPAEGNISFALSSGGGTPASGTVSAWSNTQITVATPDVGGTGPVDVTITRTDAETHVYPNMWEQTA